jgi:hypothetical protein
LVNLYLQWAKIKVNGGKAKDITNILDNYYFESDEFTLTVKGKNGSNREQGFSLKRRYQGVAFGTYPPFE